jgi:hypothetical protein
MVSQDTLGPFNTFMSVLLIVTVGFNFIELWRARNRRLQYEALEQKAARIEANLTHCVMPALVMLDTATELLRAIEAPPPGTEHFLAAALDHLDRWKGLKP